MRRLLSIGTIAVAAACTERVDLDLSGPKLDLTPAREPEFAGFPR